MAVNNVLLAHPKIPSGWRYGIANTLYGKGTTGTECASHVQRGAGAAEVFLRASGFQHVVQPVAAKLRH